jgi:hypothetical protein
MWDEAHRIVSQPEEKVKLEVDEESKEALDANMDVGEGQTRDEQGAGRREYECWWRHWIQTWMLVRARPNTSKTY